MSIKNILIFALITLVIVIATVVVMLNFFVLNNNKESEDVIKESYYFNVEEMICNIKNTSGKAILKIVIETTDEELITKFQEKTFLITNEINKVVRSRTRQELEGSNGQINLEKELVVQLRKLFDNEEIINVYFEKLIIQ